MSAAAFTKGLLDLEGSSLTPILVSLVNKDAAMLDAFGKGASEEIRAAKALLYDAVTFDADGAAAGGGGGGDGAGAGDAAGDAAGGGDAAAGAPAAPAAAASGRLSRSGSGATGAAAGGAAAAAAPRPFDRAAFDAARAAVCGLPERPLAHLRRVHELMGRLVDQLRARCMEEGAAASTLPAPAAAPSPAPAAAAAAAAAAAGGEAGAGAAVVARPSTASSAASFAKDARGCGAAAADADARRPCGGERALLMLDRWAKLSRAFCRRGRFDISKVPDVYDCAKWVHWMGWERGRARGEGGRGCLEKGLL